MQQEAEIRKLRETLDLRNKKILQLKGQIESSVSQLANRNQEFSGNSPLNSAALVAEIDRSS